MSLRSRLTLFFVAIVVLPVAALALYGWNALDRASEERSRAALASSRRAATQVFAGHVRQASSLARSLASSEPLQVALARRDRRRLQALADQARAHGLLVAVTDPAGRLLARSGPVRPRLLPGVAPPRLEALLASPPRHPLAALLQRRSVTVLGTCAGRPCRLGTVSVGIWIDRDELDRLRARNPAADLTFAIGGRPVASTVPGLTGGDAVPAGNGLGSGSIHGQPVALASGWLATTPQAPEARARLLATMPVAGTSQGARLVVLLLAVVAATGAVATLLGTVLARLLSQPLRQLAGQAAAIARGDFSQPPSALRAAGEVGELARAFERMRVELGAHLRALRSSRDELSRALGRLGEMLACTHDVPALLGVVLDAAVRWRGAEAGSVLLLDASRRMLERKASQGLEAWELAARVPVGHGVAGAVAAAAAPRVCSGEPGGTAPRRAGLEADPPLAQVSVPLLARGRVLGVLCLYRGAPFATEDARELGAFAVQAAVAIENARLHAEAERLSVTDPLTGTWNYRHFERRLVVEVERARRYHHPLALLVVDVDRFKAINDRHGHQRGDQVLVELARRVRAQVRDVDTFARYGGEEFVLVLPETDLRGAVTVAGKLHAVIGARPFGSLPVTVSVGIACYPRHAGSPGELLRAADAAMYRAKATGRDRTVVVDQVPAGLERRRR